MNGHVSRRATNRFRNGSGNLELHGRGRERRLFVGCLDAAEIAGWRRFGEGDPPAVLLRLRGFLTRYHADNVGRLAGLLESQNAVVEWPRLYPRRNPYAARLGCACGASGMSSVCGGNKWASSSMSWLISE